MSTSRLSFAAERTGQWVSTQDIPTDVVVQVGASKFPLHKFMLVEKSGLIRRKIMESTASDLKGITLSDLPGGPEAFEKVVKFCYGVNFDITVHNVVALRCAAEHLEMTDRYCHGNLADRTEEFLEKAALNNLVSAVVVLRSCEQLLPVAEDLKVLQKCVDAVSLMACDEAHFPTRSPPEWWAYELAAVSPASHRSIITAMRSRGATPRTLAIGVTAYAQTSLPDLLLSNPPSPPSSLSHQKSILESLVSTLPPESVSPVGFLCCLLRAAIFLDASVASKMELERRISAVLDQASVGDLLTVSLDFSGDRIVDLDSLKRIVAGFVEREERGGSLYDTENINFSASLRKVARTVNAFVWEIATDENLSVSKFAGIAGVLPKSARRFDDDLYRAVDIYLKAHPGLDEIEREKVCGVLDPLKLSYEARLHASQNKRLPVQIVLHSLYYDQLKLCSGVDTQQPSMIDDATMLQSRVRADASLAEENEALKSELVKMKSYISALQKGQGSSSTKSFKTLKFFTSMSKTLGKLNPFNFRQGSKDTSNIDDAAEVPKPRRRRRRRRRFSIS